MGTCAGKTLLAKAGMPLPSRKVSEILLYAIAAKHCILTWSSCVQVRRCWSMPLQARHHFDLHKAQ